MMEAVMMVVAQSPNLLTMDQSLSAAGAFHQFLILKMAGRMYGARELHRHLYVNHRHHRRRVLISRYL